MSNTEKTTFQIPTQQELEQLSELHKAMGDYSRMRILWISMGQELCEHIQWVLEETYAHISER